MIYRVRYKTEEKKKTFGGAYSIPAKNIPGSREITAPR